MFVYFKQPSDKSLAHSLLSQDNATVALFNFQACFGKVYIKSKILIKTLLLLTTVFREQVCQVGYKPKLYWPSIDLQIKSTQAEESEVSTEPHKSMKYKENENERKEYRRLLVC